MRICPSKGVLGTIGSEENIDGVDTRVCPICDSPQPVDSEGLMLEHAFEPSDSLRVVQEEMYARHRWRYEGK